MQPLEESVRGRIHALLSFIERLSIAVAVTAAAGVVAHSPLLVPSHFFRWVLIWTLAGLADLIVYCAAKLFIDDLVRAGGSTWKRRFIGWFALAIAVDVGMAVILISARFTDQQSGQQAAPAYHQVATPGPAAIGK